MGLDMYAYSLSNEQVELAEDINNAVWEGKEIFYWRKHYDLHKWFESKWKPADKQKARRECYFNGDALEITEEMLNELVGVVRSGKFWIDEHTENKDFDFIETARSELNKGNRVFYTSSW